MLFQYTGGPSPRGTGPGSRGPHREGPPEAGEVTHMLTISAACGGVAA
jgi:hypothetical protein